MPVGDDQRQHLELTREVAVRFNNRYGETFVVPEAAIPGTGARVMDLQHPERKMSKSVDSPLGTIGLLDSDEEITRKVRKAVTDTDGEMRYDRDGQAGPGQPARPAGRGHRAHARAEVAAGYERYGDLKNDVAAALCELLAPGPRAAGRAGGRPALRPTACWHAARRTPTRSRRRPTPGPPTRWVCCPTDREAQMPSTLRPPAVEPVEEPRERAVRVQEEVQHAPGRAGSASCTGGSFR